MSEQAPPRTSTRSRGVGMDMIRSLGLVAIALLVWLLFAHPRSPEVRSVEWAPVASAAAGAASFEVLAPPTAFPWQATSARVEPQPDGTVIWRAGFLTPAEDYAGLLQRGVFPAQATGSVEDWIAAETRNGISEGTVVVGGRKWERSVGDSTPDERRSLVTQEDGVVTIVTGSAEWPELEQLAASLTPVPAP